MDLSLTYGNHRILARCVPVRIHSLTVFCFHLLGNYCPICRQCYEADDFESKMMQCGQCNVWVHSKCENLTGEIKD